MTAPVTQVNICESRVSLEQETKEIRRKPGLPPDLLALLFFKSALDPRFKAPVQKVGLM